MFYFFQEPFIVLLLCIMLVLLALRSWIFKTIDTRLLNRHDKNYYKKHFTKKASIIALPLLLLPFLLWLLSSVQDVELTGLDQVYFVMILFLFVLLSLNSILKTASLLKDLKWLLSKQA